MCQRFTWGRNVCKILTLYRIVGRLDMGYTLRYNHNEFKTWQRFYTLRGTCFTYYSCSELFTVSACTRVSLLYEPYLGYDHIWDLTFTQRNTVFHIPVYMTNVLFFSGFILYY